MVILKGKEIYKITETSIDKIENWMENSGRSYVDDLIMKVTWESGMDNILKIMEILVPLGFVIHPSKSEFIPSKTIEYLGFVINMEDMTYQTYLC